ncbi:hypothetical protein M2459_002230 [Parabacteroides sp. PF5-5]|uniref:DUF4249 domain-containing protein n=1 Tax=unclassified Parabacteroides TaxID=2649774 RepID=UPI0024757ADA|nr:MULTISPECIES: DUF4249 domain-containing protein [unclassified Parabacteroides]MDH6305133.1 hypothetical protein [Parabacteroides sp. PH5-39]MDH6316483.1 hypothetical protein [Parabacteroides sp. PF5-13]MDH6319993.1 hypothetical protein [Parabacteroides sp. PH5-13]MDH6323774.1 hypothetical protein [Parabacteroides sp. PH5-8]MDH6327670.1 hypothetical protein [Parabacteroides sp. PH5-41]
MNTNYIFHTVRCIAVAAAASLTFSFSGCITEFTPEGIEEVSDLLIVDGAITDSVSTILLSHSVGLSEYLTGNEGIENAQLYVEAENGKRFDGVHEGKGTYTIATGALDTNTRYRLRISLKGNEYQSSFLAPLITPEIDSIAPTKKGQGEPVFMCVNTHDPLNQSRYYRWSYEENWEIKAELFANAGYVENGPPNYFSLSNSNNTYYCWGKNRSRILILATTEKLSDNIVYQKRLVEIPSDNEKLSVLYYIKVKQNILRKEAYDYFSNLQKNVEQTGSIFSPVPSEMKGNIECINNPELPVIGYIEVSTTVQKDLFVPENYGLYESPYRSCSNLVTDDPEFAPPVYAYYEYMPPSHVTYAPRRCVDCTTRGTKNKPDFWPNNHY